MDFLSLINSFLKTSYNSELFYISFSHLDVSNPITPRSILQLIALKLCEICSDFPTFSTLDSL